MKKLQLLLITTLFANACYGAEANTKEKPEAIKDASYCVMTGGIGAPLKASKAKRTYSYYTATGEHLKDVTIPVRLVLDEERSGYSSYARAELDYKPEELLDKDAPKPQPVKCKFSEPYGHGSMRTLKLLPHTMTPGTHIDFLDKSNNLIKRFEYDPRTKEVSIEDSSATISQVAGIIGLAPTLGLDLSQLTESNEFDLDQGVWLREYNATWACTIL